MKLFDSMISRIRGRKVESVSKDERQLTGEAESELRLSVENETLTPETETSGARPGILTLEIAKILRQHQEEILKEIKPIFSLLKEHDSRTLKGFEDLMTAKKLLSRDTRRKIENIIEDGLRQNYNKKTIVQDLVDNSLCSRATAYRLMGETILRLKSKNRSIEIEKT